MSAVEALEAAADLRLPTKADQRLRNLMDRNNDGLLSAAEKEEFESLLEVCESITLLRAKAIKALGRKPQK